MSKMPVNCIELEGRVARMDYRYGLSKTGKEFLSATFTLDIDGHRIKTETFAMKMKADGSEESGGYKSLITIWNESKTLFKTYKQQGDKEATVVEDETIVDDINDATALRMSNWKDFKYCKFVPNVYTTQSGEEVKQTRIEFAYANRVKEEEGKEYAPKKDWELTCKVKKAPVLMEKDDVEYMQFTVIVPEYVKEWKERPEMVKLQEVTLESHDESAWGYIEENFKVGAVVYLNGELVRMVETVETIIEIDDARGFGRKMEPKKQYNTKVTEYFEVMGGYVLDEDEYEDMNEFRPDLWEKAMQDVEEELENRPKPNKEWGRNSTNANNKKINNNPVVPF